MIKSSGCRYAEPWKGRLPLRSLLMIFEESTRTTPGTKTKKEKPFGKVPMDFVTGMGRLSQEPFFHLIFFSLSIPIVLEANGRRHNWNDHEFPIDPLLSRCDLERGHAKSPMAAS